jgi:hypothetical protein
MFRSHPQCRLFLSGFYNATSCVTRYTEKKWKHASITYPYRKREWQLKHGHKHTGKIRPHIYTHTNTHTHTCACTCLGVLPFVFLIRAFFKHVHEIKEHMPPRRRDLLWGSPSLLSSGFWALSQGAKRPESEGNHSPPLSVEV